MTTTAGRIPILKLWNILLVPLQGDVDDAQGEALCTDVLNAIQRSGIAGLVIDVTGLWLMDSHLCSVLSNLASSSALMGTHTVICGLSPEIALTLQSMGLDMPHVVTVPSLEDALGLMGVSQHGGDDLAFRGLNQSKDDPFDFAEHDDGRDASLDD
jgi:rsbT antagonist protein RsbS